MTERIKEILDILDLPANQYRNRVRESSTARLNQQLERETQEAQNEGVAGALLGGAGLAAGIFVEKFLMNHLPENTTLRKIVKVGLRMWDVGSGVIGGLGLLCTAVGLQKKHILREERQNLER